jgi:hypothetical protein
MPRRPEYQDRPCWITDKAWIRGCIDPFELTRIAAWKNAKSVAAITVNSPGEIEAWTEAAISAIRPWRDRRAIALTADADWASWQEAANAAIGWIGSRGGPPSGLLALKGVGYPMASAILDILDPDVWPVVDKWSAKTVFGVIPSRYNAARYAAYARHLAVEGTRCWGVGLSIHELDMRAQAASMKHDQLPDGWRFAGLPPAQ